MGKKLITFSLWGKDSKYCVGAIRNAELALKFYPGWRCRFYIGSSVPFSVTEQLMQVTKHWIRYVSVNGEFKAICGGSCDTAIELEIYHMPEPGDWRGMHWRFLPASEDDVDVFISRDCDSRLSEREATAVQEWMDGPQLVSSLGDHPYHFNPSQALMGGMFGMKRHACPEMKTLINQFVDQYPDAWQCDQDFLKDKIWPLVSHKVLAHSDLHSSCQSFPTPRINNDFVGSIIGPDEERLHPEHHEIFNAK